ncbi:hypothetical protein [Vibrio cyclitrophicus]|uniref:hypothetical protein n=1 Tax=Vibrio cyclitrophicus TaxID=47951 RepID=UPI003999C2BD
MEENTKNIKIFFLVEQLNYQHLRKSFTCIPRKLMEKYKVNAELICGNKSNLNDDILKITNLGSGSKFYLFIKSLINVVKDRRKLDIIMLLHLNIPTSLFIYFINFFFS